MKKTRDRRPGYVKFWSYITDGPEGCWLWTGRKNKGGYGVFCTESKEILAHRFSYFLHFGSFSKKMKVCHTCDVRHCVNPDHLWLGTQAENLADMYDKGRENNGHGGRPFSLDENAMRAAAKDPLPVPAVAKKYGVNRATIYRWKRKFEVVDK